MNRPELKRSDFGDFVFGAATSAYQIEGAYREDGKTDSIWDTFTRRRGKIKNRDNGTVACDHYHRVDEDIAIMRQLKLEAYRFSISWPRIQPVKGGSENTKGSDFYSRLVDKLLEAKIRPFVTLYHWDMPQYLEDSGGFLNRDTIDRFSEFASLVGRRLGDRVKDFIVFNEPMIFLTLGNLLGLHAPGRRSLKGFFAASHHVLLAQAEGARALRAAAPGAEIGTTISATAAYPASDRPRDHLAAQRFDTFFNTFYLEPVLGRGYPTEHFPALRRIERHIRPGDMEKLRHDFDFWGLNTYTRKRVKYSRFIPFVHWRELKNDPQVGETAMRWEVYPQGIYDLLTKYARYPEIRKLYITENGAAFHDQVVAGRVNDTYRIEYLREYLRAVQKAKSEGVNVAGYFAWSLLDNFEWAEGYHARFGLTHVDYTTLKRTIKDSGHWYGRLISS